MSVLVTGASGFLGQFLVERLLAHGEPRLRCLVRSQAAAAKLQTLTAKYPDAAVEYCFGTLNSRRDLDRAMEGVEVVYHAAAAMKGGPADMFMNTVVGSRNLLDAFTAAGARRLVLVSSFGVYDAASLRRGAVLDENCPLESKPQLRDPYSYAKLRQELLCREYAQKHGFELVVVRPGVIYGPGGGAFSGRVGLNVFGLFFHMGGSGILPLTFVENCAEAIVVAGRSKEAAGQVYNIHDDDLPTSSQYLRAYKRSVKRFPSIRLPYWATVLLSRLVHKYSLYSKGQLPAILTPYKAANAWKGWRFSNAKLHALGWQQRVPTKKALELTFASFRAQQQR